MIGNESISSFNIVFNGYDGSATGDNYAWYTITWTSASTDVMIKLSGHVATGSGLCGYGACYGAGDINGGPYHFKLESLDNHSLGNRDNQVMVEPNCNTDIPVTFDTPTASDNCSDSPTIAVINSDALTINTDGSRTHCRTWSATDNCGNTSAPCTQCITVICNNLPVYTVNTESDEPHEFIPVISIDQTEKISLNAMPNPFSNQTSIEFKVPFATKASLEIYTLTGVKVSTLFEGNVDAELPYNFVFVGSSQVSQETYIYVLKTDYGSQYGKLIMNR
jgi:hypothetical protein